MHNSNKSHVQYVHVPITVIWHVYLHNPLHSIYCIVHVLFIPICNYTFERNHRLVDAVLKMRTVCFQTLLLHLIDHWKHLLQPMVSGLIPRRQGRIVDEVEVARYLLEPVMCNAGGDESVVELLIPRLVVPNLGQPVHPHHYHETEVGLQLLYAGLPCSIPICSSK